MKRSFLSPFARRGPPRRWRSVLAAGRHANASRLRRGGISFSAPAAAPPQHFSTIVRHEQHYDRRRYFRKYEVTFDDGITVEAPSVTSIIDAVQNKSGLMKWQTNLVLESVREDLARHLHAGAFAAGDGGGGDAGAAAADDAGAAPAPSPAPSAAPFDAAALEALLARARQKPGTVASRAAALGTRVHSAVEAAIRGDALKLEGYADDRAVQNCLKGYRRFAQETGVTIADGDAEVVVASREYQYAGKADAFGTLPDGTPVVVDFKTSKGVWPSHALQLAAYANARNEMAGPNERPVTRGLVVQLKKEDPGGCELHWVNDLQSPFTMFTGALFLFKQEKFGAPLFAPQLRS